MNDSRSGNERGRWQEKQRDSNWLLSFALISLGVMFLALISMLVMLVSAADEREQLRQGNAVLRKDLDKLTNEFASDRAAYGNRGVVQKSLLDKAIENNWYSPAEAAVMRGVANGAKYPEGK